jgi:hypothetical protein
MYNVNGSCLIRIPFEVTAEQLSDFNTLKLRVQHDDGFVVFLNKRNAILTHHASGTPAWNSTADTVNDGKFTESFDLTPHLSKLVAGQNLLAIQALNIAPGDSDFFISVELVAGNTMKASSPISPSAILYTAPITIDHTTKIKARVYNDERWSALNEITLWVPEGNSNLKITEIHYHPLGEEGTDENEFEFIELKNLDSTSLDVGELFFSNGIDYTFLPGSSIGPGAYAVLASNAQAFESRYGFTSFGEYSGQLDNAGERIVLQTGQGDTLAAFKYGNVYPWPGSPDGSGFSLVRKTDLIYDDDSSPATWCASATIHGNPGFDNNADSTIIKEKIPTEFRLHQNYPNPFNPLTIISFGLPFRSFVTLKVYDILGREVTTVFSGELPAGTYSRQWTATGVSNGVYFYRLNAVPSAGSGEHTGEFNEARKMILVR